MDTASRAIDSSDQHGFCVQGNYEGTQADLSVFSTGYDPTPVVTESVGSLQIQFSSCTTGQIEYQLDDGNQTGSMMTERLTPDTFCQPIVDAVPIPASITLSYVGNEGVYLSDSAGGILIDAVGAFGAFFIDVPLTTQSSITNQLPPYDPSLFWSRIIPAITTTSIQLRSF